MNPLSPFIYYRRHKRQALLLLVLIGSLTLGTFVMVGMTVTTVANLLYPFHYLTRMSRILAGQALSADSVAQIRAHPDVLAVLPENGLSINYPTGPVLGSSPLLGVTGDDLALVMEVCDLRLKEGRLIEPRAAEIILSEKIARALGLQIGDHVGHDIDEDFYPAITTELTLVGILESAPSEAGPEVDVGFVPYEYLEGHEKYQPRLSNLLIIPRQGRKAAVDDFATALVDGKNSTVSVTLQTFEREIVNYRQTEKIMVGIYILAGAIVAASAALVVGMTNRIAIAQRLSELGVLHATGHAKRRLVRRLLFEIVTITGAGWGAGLLLSAVVSIVLNATSLAAAEPAIDLATPVPFLFTLPTPLAVIGWVAVDVQRVLNRLDTVAIIERGALTMEQAGGSTPGSIRPREGRSPDNPLSSWTFYLRHRQRSLALILSSGLTVLGVAFPVFASTTLSDSFWPVFLSYPSYASIVSPAPTYQSVNPAVLAQIRTHPGVDSVIPVKALSMMTRVVPFEAPLLIYGVRQEDMPALLEAFDLQLGEGNLVRPQSGQIVLTRDLAQNRGLHIGDTVGRPVYELDGMPTELTIVGLLDPTAPGLPDRKGYRVPAMPRWVGFVSYEFVENHERYRPAPMHTLVVAVKGHEAEVETWLEESIASSQVTVETFGTAYRFWHKLTQTRVLVTAIAESILAVVAAVALAILNTIFFTQRKDEFGILHATGHSRASLVARTVRESAGIAIAGWLIGAAGCLILLFAAQALVYVPRGMSLDMTKIDPWLFTLPIPAAVIAASAGTIAWALSRLDPVEIIERR